MSGRAVSFTALLLCFVLASAAPAHPWNAKKLNIAQDRCGAGVWGRGGAKGAFAAAWGAKAANAAAPKEQLQQHVWGRGRGQRRNSAARPIPVCRDGYLYVPPTYSKDKPSPMLVMFHPAGKGAKDALELLEKAQPLLDKTRTIVLLPQSKGLTWDVVMSG